MKDLRSHPDKLLKLHLKNVGDTSKNIVYGKKLNLSLISKKKLSSVTYLIGVCHDFGKCTSYFQNYLFNRYKGNLSHHGLLSALFGYFAIEGFLDNKNNLFSKIAYLVIKRHHGNLDSLSKSFRDYYGDLKAQLKNIKKENIEVTTQMYNFLLSDFDFTFGDVWCKLEKIVFDNNALDDFSLFKLEHELIEADLSNEKGIELFLLTNFLYSVLIDSDKKDAAGLDNTYFSDFFNKNISVERYLENARKENPDKFNKDKPINKLRDDFLSKTLNNPDISCKNKIYILTAPTGIGKTFTAFAFANKLKENLKENYKIIYSLPFTSIIDQNFSELEKVFKFNIGEEYKRYPVKYLFKHHYLAPLQLQKGDSLKDDSTHASNFSDYLDEKLIVESWESANIVTTFVQIFHSIIGYKSCFLKKFHNIVNSIIILDEVQNIPPKYHILAGEVFKILAKRFNTYFLLMTATQPNIFKENESIKLVESKKYFKNSCFNRVKLNIVDNLSEKTLEEFFSIIKNKIKFCNSVLIVCNTKKSAIKLYNKIKEDSVFAIFSKYSLTTNLVPYDRSNNIKEISNKLENKEKIIVVSTQLIEAGVDLSFELVYRDMGPLDSIIQVAGRCNRHNELHPEKGEMYLVQLIDKDSNKKLYKLSKKIYDPILIESSEEVLKEKAVYESEDFLKLGNDYFSNIDFKRESKQIINSFKYLNYSSSSRDMIAIKDFKLIKNRPNQEDLIICRTPKVERRLEKLNILMSKIKEKRKDKDVLNSLIGQIEFLKKEINEFKITLFVNELFEYSNSDIIKEIHGMKYVSFQDHLKYLYDKDIGFLSKPKESLDYII